MSLVQKKSKVYLTTDRWTSAFIFFYRTAGKKSYRDQDLLKYLRDIRLVANRPSGWFKFDEQFRYVMDNNPNVPLGQMSE